MERQTRADHRALQCGHRGERDSFSRQVRSAARENIKFLLPFFHLREGKLDVLRELCLENKGNSFVIEGLKSRDKFGQTPILSAVSASDNRLGGNSAIIQH